MDSSTWFSTYEDWFAGLPTTEANLEPLIWLHSPKDEIATWWQVDCIGPHPSWKKEGFVLTGRDTLAMDLFSLPSALLPKPPSVNLHNVICSKVSPQHCSWPRNSCNSCWSVAMDSCWWNSLILPCSPSPWNLWLDRMLEKPFEDLVFMASG